MHINLIDGNRSSIYSTLFHVAWNHCNGLTQCVSHVFCFACFSSSNTQLIKSCDEHDTQAHRILCYLLLLSMYRFSFFKNANFVCEFHKMILPTFNSLHGYLKAKEKKLLTIFYAAIYIECAITKTITLTANKYVHKMRPYLKQLSRYWESFAKTRTRTAECDCTKS